MIEEKINYSKNDVLITFSGTWSSSHNFQTIFECAKLLESRLDIKFVIAGKGNKFNKNLILSLIRWINSVELFGIFDFNPIR